MVEGCRAEILRDPGFWADQCIGPAEVDEGCNGLETAVVGARVDNVDGRVESEQMLSHLSGLLGAVGGEWWISGNAGGRGDGG